MLAGLIHDVGTIPILIKAKDHEMLLGSRWYRFQLPKQEAVTVDQPGAVEDRTVARPGAGVQFRTRGPTRAG